MEIMFNIAAICVGGLLGSFVVIMLLIRNNRELARIVRAEHRCTREHVTDTLNIVNLDSKGLVAIKTFVFEKYGLHLEDMDVLTIMIQWNKEIITLEEFDKFVKKFLEGKKWLYR